MADPAILGTLTLAVEKLVNAALRYDPGTRVGLSNLAGKVLALESTFPPVTIYLCPQSVDAEVGLEVHAYHEAPADTTVKGSLPAILALTFGSQHSLANSGVEISGSTALLSDFQDLMKNLDIDWEEPINELLGSTVGHPFAQMLRRQFEWIRSGTDKAQEFMGDYLAEELRATPGKTELEGFYRDVDHVRSAADRVAARVQQLQQQFDSRQGD